MNWHLLADKVLDQIIENMFHIKTPLIWDDSRNTQCLLPKSLQVLKIVLMFSGVPKCEIGLIIAESSSALQERTVHIYTQQIIILSPQRLLLL